MHAYPHVPDFPPSCRCISASSLCPFLSIHQKNVRKGRRRSCVHTYRVCSLLLPRCESRKGQSSWKIARSSNFTRSIHPWRISKFRNSRAFFASNFIIGSPDFFFFTYFINFFSINKIYLKYYTKRISKFRNSRLSLRLILLSEVLIF